MVVGRESKWIIRHGERTEVWRPSPDEFWRDDHGTVYAFRNPKLSKDNRPVCGVGIFSLPNTPTFHVVNELCGVIHDYPYESEVYQAYHDRSEADAALRRGLWKWGGALGKVLAVPFWALSRVFGGLKGKLKTWENDETR